MSVIDRITSLFGSNDTDAPTVEALESLFREREATLELTAEFHLPNPNMTDEPTAVFPYTLLDSDGDVYGSGAKEFVIPDNGFEDDNAAVTEFIGGVTDTTPANVGVGALHAVEGGTASATLNDAGDIIVEVPDAPEPTEAEAEDEGGSESSDSEETSDSADSEGGDE
jgi:hypothetical protein